MKILFLDCASGISGDMTVGALVDLGVKPSTLEWELSKLDIGDFHMHFDRQKRQEYCRPHAQLLHQAMRQIQRPANFYRCFLDLPVERTI